MSDRSFWEVLPFFNPLTLPPATAIEAMRGFQQRLGSPEAGQISPPQAPASGSFLPSPFVPVPPPAGPAAPPAATVPPAAPTGLPRTASNSVDMTEMMRNAGMETERENPPIDLAALKGQMDLWLNRMPPDQAGSPETLAAMVDFLKLFQQAEMQNKLAQMSPEDIAALKSTRRSPRFTRRPPKKRKYTTSDIQFITDALAVMRDASATKAEKQQASTELALMGYNPADYAQNESPYPQHNAIPFTAFFEVP